jgi:uncharacterized protein with FMN-binding domain
MSKAQLSWMAVALALMGVAVVSGHPDWGIVTGGAMILLAGAVAVGAIRKPAERKIEDPRAGGQKVPNSLVTLSAATIIAVYAAGFEHTRPAAEKFEAQEARRKEAARIAAIAAALPPKINIAPITPSASSASLTANTRPKRSPARVKKAVPEATPSNLAQGASEFSAASVPDSGASSTVSAASTTPSRLTGSSDTAANSEVGSQTSPAAAKPVHYKDGKFLGWGSCRHGDIQASVVIQNGKIVSSAITVCATRYSCDWISALPGQVVTRQSANVDYISGASESSDAFYDAVTAALASARE